MEEVITVAASCATRQLQPGFIYVSYLVMVVTPSLAPAQATIQLFQRETSAKLVQLLAACTHRAEALTNPRLFAVVESPTNPLGIPDGIKVLPFDHEKRLRFFANYIRQFAVFETFYSPKLEQQFS